MNCSLSGKEECLLEHGGDGGKVGLCRRSICGMSHACRGLTGSVSCKEQLWGSAEIKEEPELGVGGPWWREPGGDREPSGVLSKCSKWTL